MDHRHVLGSHDAPVLGSHDAPVLGSHDEVHPERSLITCHNGLCMVQSHS